MIMVDATAVNSGMSDGVIQASGAGISITGACWWLINTGRRRFEKNEKDIVRLDKNISDARLKMEENKSYAEGIYAKNVTIDRVHSRIDEMSKKQDDMFQFLVNKLGSK